MIDLYYEQSLYKSLEYTPDILWNGYFMKQNLFLDLNP